MELNDKQLALCLEHALGQFLSDWEGSPQEAWQRLQHVSAQNPDDNDFDETAGVVVCETYEYHTAGDIVERIEGAFWCAQQLVIRAAAPELLEALIRCEYAMEHGTSEEQEYAAKQARAAIAKATGSAT